MTPHKASTVEQGVALSAALLQFVGDFVDAYERQEISGPAADALASEGWRLWGLAHPTTPEGSETK